MIPPGFIETRKGDLIRARAIDTVCAIQKNEQVPQKILEDYKLGLLSDVDFQQPVTAVFIREAVWIFQLTVADFAAIMNEAIKQEYYSTQNPLASE